MPPPKPLNEILTGLPTTIFSVMTELAIKHKSVNLGQGANNRSVGDAKTAQTCAIRMQCLRSSHMHLTCHLAQGQPAIPDPPRPQITLAHTLVRSSKATESNGSTRISALHIAVRIGAPYHVSKPPDTRPCARLHDRAHTRSQITPLTINTIRGPHRVYVCVVYTVPLSQTYRPVPHLQSPNHRPNHLPPNTISARTRRIPRRGGTREYEMHGGDCRDGASQPVSPHDGATTAEAGSGASLREVQHPLRGLGDGNPHHRGRDGGYCGGLPWAAEPWGRGVPLIPSLTL